MLAPTLVTERLVLRPFVDEDAPLIAEGIFADPEAVAHLPEEPRTPAEQLECAWHYLRIYREPWGPHGWGGWAVVARGEIAPTGTLLGYCGFEAGQIEDAGPELGYGLFKAFWGRGLGSEAAARAVAWYFREGGHDACYACHAPSNAASGRIIEKAGLIRREDRDLWDSVAKGAGLLPFYSVTREEYLTAAH